MHRFTTRLMVFVAALVMSPALLAQKLPPVRDQLALKSEVVAMNARIVAGKREQAQAIADAQRIAAIYNGLGPYARTYGVPDYALNRHLADESFYWLDRARALYLTDWAVAPYLMQAYDAMGAFYHDYGVFYPAGAYLSYGGAARMARLLYLSGANRVALERELERYGLAYATAACFEGRCFDWWVPPVAAQEPPVLNAGEPISTPEVTQLPPVDRAQLTAEQRAAWTELQDRFRLEAVRVHEARGRVNSLATRLAQRGMHLNAADAATAANMQGFLDDAVELAASHEFRLASEAVMRAEATRTRLAHIVGR